MKPLAAVVLLVATVGAVATAAQRIFTKPGPDAELRQLFPSAAAFSGLEGEPLHFTAYRTDPDQDPAAEPLGIAFWTTDLVPDERGYHGPIHVLVGMDFRGTIVGVVVVHDTEPYGYFSVQLPEFAAQFAGKSLRDPFRVGEDVDAISRATITLSSATRAIRDSARMVARQVIAPAAGQP